MSFEIVAFRAADFDTPLWAFPNLSTGRYNVANREPATQYLSLHPMTPWAELLRHFDKRDEDEARDLRVAIWAIRLQLADDPVDITFDNVSAYAFEPEDLVSDDYAASQRLAGALDRLGVSAFTAPSAALPGTTNLMILRPAAVVDFHAEPVDPDYDWPTSLVARDGRCPHELWEYVHYKGVVTRHPALVAWEDGDDFEFEQPTSNLHA